MLILYIYTILPGQNSWPLTWAHFALYVSVTDSHHFKDEPLLYHFNVDYSRELTLMDLVVPPPPPPEIDTNTRSSQRISLPNGASPVQDIPSYSVGSSVGSNASKERGPRRTGRRFFSGLVSVSFVGGSNFVVACRWTSSIWRLLVSLNMHLSEIGQTTIRCWNTNLPDRQAWVILIC